MTPRHPWTYELIFNSVNLFNPTSLVFSIVSGIVSGKETVLSFYRNVDSNDYCRE